MEKVNVTIRMDADEVAFLDKLAELLTTVENGGAGRLKLVALGC